MMRLNGFGWLAVATSLVTSLVIAGCGSVGQPKPSVEFKVAVPVKTVTAQNFAWGECPVKYHAERCSLPDPVTGYFECACVRDPE